MDRGDLEGYNPWGHGHDWSDLAAAAKVTNWNSKTSREEQKYWVDQNVHFFYPLYDGSSSK